MSDAAADPAMEAAVKWARSYVEACDGVLTAANACLDAANPVIAAEEPQDGT